MNGRIGPAVCHRPLSPSRNPAVHSITRSRIGRGKRTEVMAGIEIGDDGLRSSPRRHSLGQRRAIGNERISPSGHDEDRHGGMRSILYRVRLQDFDEEA